MLELLTGTGLAASAGLNAYIPLLALGLLARFTNLLTLPSGWQWLENGWVLAILAVLLIIEFVADKVPIVDSVNDAVQTVIRPTAGGLAFGAGAGASELDGGTGATVSDPGAFFSDGSWMPVAIGAVVALAVHIVKALVRPVINTMTMGIGAPVVSTAEDATSVVMSLVAIIMPILVIFFLIGLVVVFVLLLRRRSRRKAERAGQHQTYPHYPQ